MYEYFYEQAELSANKNEKKTVEIAKVELSQTQKKSEINHKKTYNWHALVKHPKTNKNFVAINVSNEKAAKKIAISKCYEFVTKQLSKRGYTDCYVDLIVDGTKDEYLSAIRNEIEGQAITD